MYKKISKYLSKQKNELTKYLLPNKYYSKNVKNEADIVVSLTTYNKRFSIVHLTIDSLLSQNINKNFEVRLYLSEEDLKDTNGEIPKKIIDLKKYGLQIFIESENIKSYKKIFYTLEEHKTKTIVTADDDIIYPRYWLRSLVNKSNELPNCIICYRGHFFSFTPSGKLAKYIDIQNKNSDDYRRTTPSFLLIPTGVSGILYPPNSLDEIARDKDLFLKLTPHGDDIWLKMSSLKKGIKCVQVENENIHFDSTLKQGDESLFHKNINLGWNDEQINTCFKKFPDLLEILRSEYINYSKSGY